MSAPDAVIAELATRILALRGGSRTVLVAIDGLGGSGKSSLAAQLATHMQNRGETQVAIVHGDDFFLPSARRAPRELAMKLIGADVDWRRLREQVLEPLRRERPARYQVYDWNGDRLAEWRSVAPGAIALVEGVYTLRPELRALYDLRLWVDCARDVRLARGLARDGEGARSRWERDWMPSEDWYVSECQPAAGADVIVSDTLEEQ